MNKSLLYTKEVEVKFSADIVVAGGGPAGVSAAVSAAKLGAKVYIIEQSGTFGGSSILAGVPELMNFDDGEKFISHGFGKEVFDALGLKSEFKREWYNVRPEQLKRVYDNLIEESKVNVLFYTRVVDAILDNGEIKALILSGAEGVFAIEGKAFIDATGSGALSVLAGAEYEYGDENGTPMSATLCSMWGGVDFSKKGYDNERYMEAYNNGVFSQYDTVLPGIKANFPEINVGFGNVGHSFELDDTSTESLTQATLHARKILKQYEKYYKEYVRGCENSVLIKSADYIGIRASRRIKCEYMLTKDDYFKKESFYDEIGRYSYPIDIHPITSDKEGMEGFSKAVSIAHNSGESYSIPFRSLVVKGVRNLLVAGRNIGADHYMQASIRVIPACYITGQGAGAAASIAVENSVGVKDISIEKLKEKLASLCK